MLTINSAVNQNYKLNPSFGRQDYSRNYDRDFDNDYGNSDFDIETAEYKEERNNWIAQKEDLQNMILDKEANLPKPVKNVMKGGVILASGVLGGMATGYSAKYIMDASQKMYKSKTIQNLVKGSEKHIKTPVKNAFNSAKTYLSKQVTKAKNSKTYTENKVKLGKQYDKFKDSNFVKTVNKYVENIKNNKVVVAVTGFIDKVASKIADGVVKVYNKLAGVNYKEATVNSLGVAGGVSTGAMTMFDEVKNNADNVDYNFEESYMED